MSARLSIIIVAYIIVTSCEMKQSDVQEAQREPLVSRNRVQRNPLDVFRDLLHL